MNSDLKEILKSKNEDLFFNSQKIRETAKPLLNTIKNTFPEFTPHEIKHSDKIIDILNWFIPETLKNQLNFYEIYFLITSAYLHDIGMADLTTLKRFHGENSNSIRNFHHLRSEKYIVDNFQDLGIKNEHEARIIGRISRGHRKENLSDNNLFKPQQMYNSVSINMPFVSVLIRLADELDLTYERTPYEFYDNIQIKDEISKNEWKRHLDTSGTGLSSENPLRIICSASCKNLKIHRALKKLETKINEELNDVENHLHNYRDFVKDVPYKFSVEIDPIGYKVHDFRFSLQEKEIINLLMGERLYKEKDESIRELLKNSVDGCRFRRDLLSKKGLEYNPNIVFELTSDGKKLIVSDNGSGMNEDIINRYFTKIGRSFYRSYEFEENANFTPVSELGIGILSYFMIANKITVETKTEDDNALLIEIDDLSDYFYVQNGTRTYPGTTVTLFLKSDFDEENLLNTLSHYARHLEFSIKFINYQKDESILISGIKSDMEHCLNKHRSFEKKKKSKHHFHFIKLCNEYINGYIALLFKNNELEPGWWSFRYKNSISNEGIFVNNEEILPDYISSNGFRYDINLKKDALDFNIARNGIIENNKLINIKKNLGNLILEGLERFLNEINFYIEKKEDKDKFEFFKELFFHYFNGYILKDLVEDNCLPVNFENFIKEYYYFKCISSEGICYLKYNDLLIYSPSYILYEGNCVDEKQVEQIFLSSDLNNGKLYILSENKTHDFIKCIFYNRSINLFSTLRWATSKELEGMLLKTWKLVKFKNYKSSRLMEFDYPTIINRDNKFIDLLIKYKEILNEERRVTVEGFFRSLKIDLRDIEKVRKKQTAILNWYVEDKLIDNIDEYLVKEEDFPSRFFK